MRPCDRARFEVRAGETCFGIWEPRTTRYEFSVDEFLPVPRSTGAVSIAEVPFRLTRGGSTMHQKIVPNLWFDTKAEEAAGFYASVFKNSRIVNVTHFTETKPRRTNTVMTVDFELDGQR